MEDVEIWEDISETEGYYSVSSMGRVRSNARVVTNEDGTARSYRTKILKPCLRRSGYLKVNLCLKKGVSQQSIHRLVATSFLSNDSNFAEVNHLDNDPTNNCAGNLEWCSRLRNVQHCVKQQRNFVPSHNRLPEDTKDKIAQMYKLGLSGRAISKDLGVSQASVKRHKSF